MERIPITKEALERLKKELQQLQKVDKPENIRAIEEARAHGDLSENAEYHAAKERQAFIASKIAELKSSIGKAEVLSIEDGPTDNIIFGRTVLLYNIQSDEEVKYQLLGPYESDPEAGKISVTSPLGQALVGKSVGDELTVKAPGGIQEFEVLEIL